MLPPRQGSQASQGCKDNKKSIPHKVPQPEYLTAPGPDGHVEHVFPLSAGRAKVKSRMNWNLLLPATSLFCQRADSTCSVTRSAKPHASTVKARLTETTSPLPNKPSHCPTPASPPYHSKYCGNALKHIYITSLSRLFSRLPVLAENATLLPSA